MKKVELILPAGNWDALKAAVENGADAVYLGIDRFNARKRAVNFTLDNFVEVTDYCHQNGVKVYCTMNVLVKNHELEDFFESTKKLYEANVDAIIIQEISFLPLLKKNFPDLEVHISTQAAVTNHYFKELIKQADKVVLPREFTEGEITEFISHTNLPVEIFIQGALCFSYSGKCLFSSFLGGRSGNRGLCAQPCRKKYNGKYLLSMKDLCLLKKIPALIEMGVSSLKVEGRLRSPKYIAAATKTYRQAIDSYYAHQFSLPLGLFKEMELSFNREFTEGYFSKEQDLISSDRPMGRGLFLGTLGEKKSITLKEDLSVGDGVGIWFKNKVDGAIITKIELAGKSVQEAKKGDQVQLFIHASSGTKIYKTSSIKKPIVMQFKQKKAISINRKKIVDLILPEIKHAFSNGKEKLLVKVYSKKNILKAFQAGADKVFYDLFDLDVNDNCGGYVPRIINSQDVSFLVDKIIKLKITDLLIGDLGVYAFLKEKSQQIAFLRSLNLYLDYSNNIFNDYDLNFFSDNLPIISPELSFQDLQDFKNKNFAVFVHGKIALMNTKYPALPEKLTDEKKYTFPVHKEHEYYQILNSCELGFFEEILKLKKIGIKNFFLDLDHDVEKIVKTYHHLLAGKNVEIYKKGYTLGHFKKSVD